MIDSQNLLKRTITALILGIIVLSFYYVSYQGLAFILILLLEAELIISTCGCGGSQNSKVLIFALGHIYLILTSAAFVMICRSVSASGYSAFIGMMLSVIVIDTAGYIAGKLVEGPKMLPGSINYISPNKTLFGFVMATLIGAFVFNIAFFSNYTVSTLLSIILSILFAIVVQLGDILISFCKRKLEIKDTSNLLPGHGGVWDRFDGVLAGALFITILNTSLIELRNPSLIVLTDQTEQI